MQSERFAGGHLHRRVSSLDAAMRKHFGKEFVEADEKDQTRMLDMLVAEERTIGARDMGGTGGQYAHFRDYQAWERPTLAAEAVFFDWVRKMAVDAYYTSPIGVKDLGYVGNGAFSSYEVPEAAIEYAMKRSPFA
ncbi:MAG: gluconate 2-dehydrogenase subunit 3 family protein [Bryobacterales bacterium]